MPAAAKSAKILVWKLPLQSEKPRLGQKSGPQDRVGENAVQAAECVRENPVLSYDARPLHAFNEEGQGTYQDQSDLKFTMGLQGGARVGVTKLFGLKVDVDLGSREFSVTGKEYVNENYTFALDLAGFSLQLDAKRNVEVHDFQPGVDSINGILRGRPFEWKPGIGTPWNTSASEFWKLDIGASLLFGVEGTLDFNAVGND